MIRNAEPVADFTVGLMYAATRNIGLSHRQVMNGQYQNNFQMIYIKRPYQT
ncbi:hypothetical protein GQR36_12000 [Enterococcus termitis]